MRLTPKQSPAQAFKSLYDRAIRETLISESADLSRALSLRCSQLPFCPVGFFSELALTPTIRSLDFMGLFYTQVGHAVHYVMQTGLMQASPAFVGDWKCTRCKKFVKLRPQPTCCGLPMAYEELVVDYKGIKGHVDTLWILEAKGLRGLKLDNYLQTLKLKQLRELLYDPTTLLYVVDYKTCSLNNQSGKLRKPEDAYVAQIRAYVYLLRKQYGLNVVGCMLHYVPRDNPKNADTVSFDITKTDLKQVMSDLKRWKQAHKKALAAKSLTKALELYTEYGACNNPFCRVCQSRDPKAILRNAFERGNERGYLPLGDYLKGRAGAKRK